MSKRDSFDKGLEESNFGVFKIEKGGSEGWNVVDNIEIGRKKVKELGRSYLFYGEEFGFYFR